MSSLHHHTPSLTAIDSRGLHVRTVEYHRANAQVVPTARIHRQVFSANGFLSQQWDPRLYALHATEPAVPPNQHHIHSLSGQVLRTDSVDSGWRIALIGTGQQRLHTWTGRGNRQRYEFDDQLRPMAVYEQDSDEPQERCVERFGYGAMTPGQAVRNRCGRLIRHDDPAGSVFYEQYALSGAIQIQSRRFFTFPHTADWPAIEAQRDPQLEPERYSTAWTYNALGDLLERTDAKGNHQQSHYGVQGELTQIALIFNSGKRKVLMDQRVYNALGQVISERAGNNVMTVAAYAETDGRLQRLTAYRSGHHKTPLQDLAYTYDRVGNVLSILDNAQPTIWASNTRVEGFSTFEYDTLYQLIKATGRENARHPGGSGLPGRVDFGATDTDLLRTYTRHYQYDPGANLTQMQHVPSSGQGYTQRMTVAERSNHSLLETSGVSPGLGQGFDLSGNLHTLTRGQILAWNVRNQLTRVSQVQREDGADDEKTYAYDSQGLRVLKRRSSQAKGLTHIDEVRYLPGLEIRRHHARGEWLNVATVEAGSTSVRALTWEQGLPPDIDNEQLRFSLSDSTGSSTLELDEQAALLSQEGYYPFGATAWWAARNAIQASLKTVRYSGKERDATGLYDYGFRYYAPWLQRWISADPAGDVDGLNLFAMVSNNPMTLVDHNGLAETLPWSLRVFAGLVLIGLFTLIGSVFGWMFGSAGAGAGIGALPAVVLFVLRQVQIFNAPKENTSPALHVKSESEFAEQVTVRALELAERQNLSDTETVKLANFFYARRQAHDGTGLTMAIYPTASGDLYGYVGPVTELERLRTTVKTGRPPTKELRQMGFHNVLLRSQHGLQGAGPSLQRSTSSFELQSTTQLPRQRTDKQGEQAGYSRQPAAAPLRGSQTISIDVSVIEPLLQGPEARSIALAISHVSEGRFAAVNWHQHQDQLWSADLHGYQGGRRRNAFRLMFEHLGANRYRVAGIRNPH